MTMLRLRKGTKGSAFPLLLDGRVGCDLAGSEGAQMASTFLLTPAPVLAEHVAAGGILELPPPLTLFRGLLAKDDFFFFLP